MADAHGRRPAVRPAERLNPVVITRDTAGQRVLVGATVTVASWESSAATTTKGGDDSETTQSTSRLLVSTSSLSTSGRGFLQGGHVPHIFKTLADIDTMAFCAGADDPAALRRQLDSSLQVGTTRAEWCWLALDLTGQILARHYWWGLPNAARPMGIELVSVEDHAAAVGLFRHAQDGLDVEDAWCCVTAPVEEGDDPSVARAPLVAVLAECRFGFEVSRVSIEWSAGTEIQPDSGRLVFRPARSLTDDVLVALFSAVADGSLDHGMITDRARHGAEGEARQRLARARSYRAEPDWFHVAFTPTGEPAGYVMPGLADETPMIAEVGVAASHRGNGYVDDLLAWATRLLATGGARRIIADTDRANAPMRAAFKRAGYREFRWRDDYQ